MWQALGSCGGQCGGPGKPSSFLVVLPQCQGDRYHTAMSTHTYVPGKQGAMWVYNKMTQHVGGISK